MIDFIQYIIKDIDVKNFLETHKPDEYANIRTGEIKYPIILKDGPIEIQVLNDYKTKSQYLKLKGSIHKYFNYYNSNDSQNFDSLSIPKIKECLDTIFNKYKLNTNGYFQGLEVGFNLSVSFCPTKFITDSITHCKGKPHSKKCPFRNRGMIVQFEFTNYIIKIYDKGKQYGLSENIIRLEIKFRTRRSIENLGCYSIGDLLNKEVNRALYCHLKGKINDISIVDSVEPTEGLTGSEKEVFYLFTNAQRYNQFKKRISRQTLSNYKLKYDEILLKYNLASLKNEILERLNSKFLEYIGSDKLQVEKCPILSNHYLTKSTLYISGICQLHSDHPIRHKIRNDLSNPRNNLKKRILRIVDNYYQGTLFPDAQIIHLSKEQYTILSYWNGTKYDVFKTLESKGFQARIL